MNRSSKTAEFVKTGSMREPAWSVRTVVVRLYGQCLFVGADSVCSSVLAVFVRRCGQTVSVRLCGQRVSVGTVKSVSVQVMQDKSLAIVFVKRRHNNYAFVVELV